jgi:hypothetical protein
MLKSLCGPNTPSLRLTCDIFSHPAPSPTGAGAFSSRTRSLLVRASGTIEGDTGGLSRVEEDTPPDQLPSGEDVSDLGMLGRTLYEQGHLEAGLPGCGCGAGTGEQQREAVTVLP